MMKKFVLCLLLTVLLFPFHGKAESADPTGFDLSSLAEDTVFLANLDDPSQSVLGLERNADVKRYPASTTKIMTCILALELCDPDEPVTVSKRACNLSARNCKMGLIPGETYRMIDLLYGLMLPSGNDAANAIAEHIGGSNAGFAELMNEKARELGMEHTHFLNPHGLHNAEHYTTARDMSVLTAYALENETFAKIVSTTEYTAKSADGRKLTLRSSNRLLRDVTANSYEPYSCLYPSAIGVKTGDTHLAGKCLVAAARRGDTTYILILLHGDNAPDGVRGREKDLYSAQRFYDAIALFEYAFEHDTVSVDAAYLHDRCLPDTYAYIPDPKDTLIREALYSIDWHDDRPLILPRWQADLLFTDPFPEENLLYSVDDLNASIGETAGTVSVCVNGYPVLTGDLIAEDYTYPPTPAPTEEPHYTIEDETPAPALTASPESTPVPVSPSVPETFPMPAPIHNGPSWFERLFRCAPAH
jgi:D-alanyl-D-alanine carboxypeptidase